MRQDEIKDRLGKIEWRLDIIEKNLGITSFEDIKLKPKKKIPIKEVQSPKIGVTTEPFNPESKGAPKPKDVKVVNDKTTLENIGKPAEETPSKFSKEYSKTLDEEPDPVLTLENDNSDDSADIIAQKPLDIDPLDKHLNDEMLEKKYGDRTEEAKKLIAELDNEK